ncbi:SH3 domain-containing protein [Exiguobacterium mexicanum]|uniref:SH3 domain-containing protein n=1 Tax=Exiguobacterium mexicanum TaxID=340146 RepID=UPI00110DAD5D|nr:SH3 domain-containing protein [Exiguobacterium mexicanum]
MNKRSKRLSTAIFLSGVLFATMYTQDVNAASKTATVDTSILNVRQSSSTSSPIVGKLTKGNKVSVLNVKGSWAEIDYKGAKRYVSSAYLKMTTATPAPTSKVKQTYTVTDNLNLRQSASLKARVLVTIPKNKEVQYLSKTGTWYRVKYGSKTGYVAAKYVKVQNTVVKNATAAAPKPTTVTKNNASSSTTKQVYATTVNLNLRSTASTKGKVLVTIPKNKEVQYIAKSGNWFKVKYGSKTGFVSASYIKVTNKSVNPVTVKPTAPKPTPKPPASTTTKTNVYKTKENLNLRSSASLSGKVLVTIPKNKEVQYISKSGNWYRVKYGSKTGYVSASYVAVTTKTVSPVAPKPTPKPPASTPVKKVTYKTKENLNLRSAASWSGKILLTIPKNKEVTYVSKSGSWYRVTYNGKTGYVASSYLTEVKPTSSKPVAPTAKKYYYTTANLNLRDKNSLSGKVMTTILTDKQVEFVSAHGDWYKVKYDGKVGYVSKKYLTEKSPASTSKPVETEEDYSIEYEAIVTAMPSLKVRSTPQVTASNEIGTVLFNQIIGVIEHVNDSWVKIEFELGDKLIPAYVSSAYIKPYTGPTVPETIPGTKNVVLNYSDYELKLTDMVQIQKNVNAQTDKYRGSAAYVSKEFIQLIEGTQSGRVSASTLNVRADATTNSHIYGVLNSNSVVSILGEKDNFYIISYKRKAGESERVFDNAWRLAMESDILNQVDPRLVKFEAALDSPRESFQYLDLSKSSSVSATILNKALQGKGILSGQAQAFIDAGKAFNINEIYLMSHAFLETGNGTSTLASGVWVDTNGNLSTSTSTRHKLVYNMYGIGATDANPTAGGAKHAFDNGWFTPAASIYGGGEWISKRYVNNTRQQNTLYKMRFNPAKPGTYQYATDIEWAYKQTFKIHEIYKQLEEYTVEFDIPRFIY